MTERLLRIAQICGQRGVTEQEALLNKRQGRGAKRVRPEIPGLLPIAKSTWWAGVKSGKFPQPIRLPGRVTVWRMSEIEAWLDQQADEVN